MLTFYSLPVVLPALASPADRVVGICATIKPVLMVLTFHMQLIILVCSKRKGSTVDHECASPVLEICSPPCLIGIIN